MKFFRRILKHIFLLAFIVLLGAVYYYRHQLFPDFMAKYGDDVEQKIVGMVTPDETEKAEPAPAAKPDQPAESAEPGEETAKPAKAPEPVPAPAAASAEAPGEANEGDGDGKGDGDGDSDAVAPQSQSATRAPAADVDGDQAPAPKASLTDQDQPAAKAEPTVSDQDQPTPAAQPLVRYPVPSAPQQPTPVAPPIAPSDASPVVPTVVPPVAPAPTDDKENAIMSARRAYWLRDYAAAESEYQALAKSQPDNPNAHGELGNVYYAQGKWKQAAAAYAQAAEMLHKQGHRGRAAYLHRIIQGLDAEQARELAAKLTAKPADADE